MVEATSEPVEVAIGSASLLRCMAAAILSAEGLSSNGKYQGPGAAQRPRFESRCTVRVPRRGWSDVRPLCRRYQDKRHVQDPIRMICHER